VKVFVTGGTGFVGSHLVDSLLDFGDKVTVLVRDPEKARRLFRDRPVRTVPGNLQDTKALEAGCAGADVVYHIAGLTAARNGAEFRAVNDNATRTLATIAGRVAPDLKHFVYLSSIAAAGPSKLGTPHTENTPTRPVSDYGWSKLAGEKGVQASGLPWTIVRPPTVFGPRDTEVLKIFRLAKLGLAPVFGDGRQNNSFVFAPDLAQALIACRTEQAVEKIFFACHPEVRTQRELATEIFRALRGGPESGQPIVLPIPAPLARGVLWITGTAASLARKATILNADRAKDFLAEAWTCSPEAIRRDTGWSAATDLESGLRQTVKWYRTHGWL